jgi:hypothetical protein
MSEVCTGVNNVEPSFTLLGVSAAVAVLAIQSLAGFRRVAPTCVPAKLNVR